MAEASAVDLEDPSENDLVLEVGGLNLGPDDVQELTRVTEAFKISVLLRK